MNGRSLYRLCVFALLAGMSVGDGAQAAARKTCKPALAFKNVRFSAMTPPTLQRTWTAVLSIDASSCRTKSGSFAIGFSRLKEDAPDADFQAQFTWVPRSVEVSMDFWADEAVGAYWLDVIAPCPCRE